MKFKESDIKAALSRKHHTDFFIDAVKTGPSWLSDNMRIIDFWVLKKSWVNFLISAYEIKVSKSDFRADEKWAAYLDYCNAFYFAVPKGLVSVEQVEDKARKMKVDPENVGLIYIYDNLKTTRIIKKVKERNNEIPAEIFQYILMNKVYPDRYPFFSDKREYFEMWLANKIKNRHIALKLNGKIRDELSRMSEENDNYNYLIDKIDKIMNKKIRRDSLYPYSEFKEIIKIFENGYNNINENMEI